MSSVAERKRSGLVNWFAPSISKKDFKINRLISCGEILRLPTVTLIVPQIEAQFGVIWIWIKPSCQTEGAGLRVWKKCHPFSNSCSRWFGKFLCRKAVGSFMGLKNWSTSSFELRLWISTEQLSIRLVFELSSRWNLDAGSTGSTNGVAFGCANPPVPRTFCRPQANYPWFRRRTWRPWPWNTGSCASQIRAQVKESKRSL